MKRLALLRRSFRARPARRNDHGSAMITVILIGVVLTSVAAVSVTNALTDLNRSTSQLRRSTALQAAEAGVADYLAKLTEDHAYYLHNVHLAESTRNNGAGLVVGAGNDWDGNSDTWTYPARLNTWRTMANASDGTNNGYEYNLEIVGPSELDPTIKIVSTGRRSGATREMRRIEVSVRPSSLADYLMVSNRDITYGSGASTNGKIYAGTDETAGCSTSGRHCGGQNVTHNGSATGDVFAEGQTLGSTTFVSPARAYDSDSTPTLRSILPSQILFSSFVNSLVDIRAAAGLPAGIMLNDASVDAWRLSFNANATITIDRCVKAGGLHPAEAAPICTPHSTRAVPSNGAIFVEQSAIVGGIVDGQMTLVTKGDAIIATNVTYERRGNDVLGIIAENNVLMAAWSPASLTLYAAVIARSGQYRSWSPTLSKSGTFTHVGATATFAGGYMSMFAVRAYRYDANLRFLQPPYYPVVGDDYVVETFRELVPPIS